MPVRDIRPFEMACRGFYVAVELAMLAVTTDNISCRHCSREGHRSASAAKTSHNDQKVSVWLPNLQVSRRQSEPGFSANSIERIRRVKCDETLPFCKRCTSTGRQCDGPPKHKTRFVVSQPPKQKRTASTSSSSQSSTTPPSTQLSPVPNLSAASKRALSFFIDRAGPALGGELDQEFWHTSVLQLCHQSSMVRNAVLAVSTLYESPLSNPLSWPTTANGNFNKPEQRQAFKWYSESLSGMSEVFQQPQSTEQLHVALTTCILFACIEFQQLNVVNAIQLMKCGYNLLGQDSTKESMSRSPIIRHVLLPVFLRQTIVLLLHGYPLPQGWLPPELNVADPASLAISSLQEARTQLCLIMFDVVSIVTAAYLAFDPATLAGIQESQFRTLNRIVVWRQNLDTYILFVNHYQSLTPPQTRAVSLLNIYYLVTTTWLTACTHPDEMIWDTFTPEMTLILDHAETILSFHHTAHVTYTFEMGIIPPLYFVGWRCRVPSLRRRALRLLTRCPNQESLFHRDVEIFALRKIIEIEEGLPSGADVLASTTTTDDIVPPEPNRLRHVLVRWDTDAMKTGNLDGKSRPHLVYSKWVLKEGEDGVVREMVPQVVSI